MNNSTQTQFPISRYLNVRRATSPSFASDGRSIAFLTNITGLPQVWQVALPIAPGQVLWPEQRSFATDRVMQVICSPVPDDDLLIYVRDLGGNEKAQFFLLDTDGTETHLTAGFDDVMHIFGEWTKDGTHILFAANRRHPALFDLYIQSIDDKARLIWENNQPGYLYNQTLSPDGKKVLLTRMSSSFSHTLWEIDVESGEARQLLPSDEPVRHMAACYAPNGHSIYLNTDFDSDFLYIAQLDLETNNLRALITPPYDCGGLELAPDKKTLAYTINIDGVSQLQIFDIATGTIRTAPGLDAVPGVVMGSLAFSPDSAKIAFAFTSAVRTGDIYVWDLNADTVTPITASSHGGIPTRAFVVPELVRYPTFDKDADGNTRRIPAWLYTPTDAPDEPAPAIIIPHGGPESQYRPYFNFIVQYIVHHGYAVLAPNVRGSTGYGKAYSHLDDVEKRMDSVADLAHGAYWLQEQPGIDGERLVVYGGSYGGFMVLSAMTTYPDLWAAGVDIVGVANFVTFLENTSDYRRAHREAEYGSLEHDREFLTRISPANHLDKIAAPLIVIHGANDPRVPLSEAEQVVDTLKGQGISTDFLVFDDEGHGLVKLKNKLVAYPAIIAFLDKHLC